MADFYEIKFPVEVPGVKKRWVRIGSATGLPTGIACRLDAIPVNWNGEFYLFPSANKAKEETANDH